MHNLLFRAHGTYTYLRTYVALVFRRINIKLAFMGKNNDSSDLALYIRTYVLTYMHYYYTYTKCVGVCIGMMQCLFWWWVEEAIVRGDCQGRGWMPRPWHFRTYTTAMSTCIQYVMFILTGEWGGNWQGRGYRLLALETYTTLCLHAYSAYSDGEEGGWIFLLTLTPLPIMY